MIQLSPSVWQASQRSHEERADAFTAARRKRLAATSAMQGKKESIAALDTTQFKDEVADFLYTYYAVRPGVLRRWHPGIGNGLLHPERGETPTGSAAPEHTDWRWYKMQPVNNGFTTSLDLAAYLADRLQSVSWIRDVLAATALQPAQLGCLGLHEWAMAYRAGEKMRHQLPLRLGQIGTDNVVEQHQIRCSHFDAFRFFTPEAKPRNTLELTPMSRTSTEQPGCLHANMDLLRHALKLGPAVPGDLLLDCFELARDIRILDMEASPYDVRGIGYGVVEIETAPGRAEYIARQRTFSQRAEPLRARLLDVCAALLTATAAPALNSDLAHTVAGT